MTTTETTAFLTAPGESATTRRRGRPRTATPNTESPGTFRYETAQVQLPAKTRELLSKLRSDEHAGKHPAALTNLYLMRLAENGWTLRVLANGFDGVTVEAVRERIMRAQKVVEAAGEGSVGEIAELDPKSTIDRALGTAFEKYAELTKRPENRRDVPADFAEAYRAARENLSSTAALRLVRGAAKLPVRSNDPRDVRRVIAALTKEKFAERAEKLLDEKAPDVLFPAVESEAGVDYADLTKRFAKLAEPVSPPKKPEPEVIELPKKYEIPAERARTLARLQEKARLVKGSTPIDHPNRHASKELADLMYEELQNGATYHQIAQAAGVTWNAVKFRLGRYGKVDLPPSMADTRLRVVPE